jgi:hypothetical protein
MLEKELDKIYQFQKNKVSSITPSSQYALLVSLFRFVISHASWWGNILSAQFLTCGLVLLASYLLLSSSLIRL